MIHQHEECSVLVDIRPRNRGLEHEMLANPDDVAAGYVMRFRRAPEDVVCSREPAHPAIVSVEEFTRAQVMRRSREQVGRLGSRSSDAPDRLRPSGSTCCVVA